MTAPPEKRYQKVIKDMKDDILVMMEYFQYWLTLDTLNYIDSHLDEFKNNSPEIY